MLCMGVQLLQLTCNRVINGQYKQGSMESYTVRLIYCMYATHMLLQIKIIHFLFYPCCSLLFLVLPRQKKCKQSFISVSRQGTVCLLFYILSFIQSFVQPRLVFCFYRITRYEESYYSLVEVFLQMRIYSEKKSFKKMTVLKKGKKAAVLKKQLLRKSNCFVEVVTLKKCKEVVFPK